ncbi:MAG: gliding motility-associated C-terminal domain-containing protein [Bacteroidota bacterium]
MNTKKFTLSLFFLFTLLFANAQVTFTVTNASAVPNEAVCVDVFAEDFVNITNMQFSMGWNPNIIRLDSINNINIPVPETFEANLNLIANGQLPIIWFDPLGAGISVPDSLVLFSLCFTAVGIQGQCSDVEFTNIPLAMDISDLSSNGGNIGLNPMNGIFCVSNQLQIVDSEIILATCSDPTNSEISVTLEGGVAPFIYNWRGPSNFISSDPVISNLLDGIYRVTIVDSGTPQQSVTESFTLTNDFNFPTVEAGEDQSINCADSVATLNGQASSMGSEFIYRWTTNDGNILSGDNTLLPMVDGLGTYTLIITNTSNGCIQRDMVTVFLDTIAPVAEAAVNSNITCQMLEVELNTTGSSTGDDISYGWTTQGGNIVSGADSSLAQVDNAGLYLLTVTNTDNGCTATAEVLVEDETVFPLAEAGAPEVDCAELAVSIAATGILSDEFEYNWVTSDGLVLAGADSAAVQVGQAGTYILQITDPTNGCTVNSEVIVEEALFLEAAEVGEMQSSCINEGMLQALLPANVVGEWISDTDALIDDPLADTTVVSNLAPGLNQFIWTLSSDECPDYDSDTLSLFIESTPGAQDDDVVALFGQNSTIFNLVNNDSLVAVSSWQVSLISTPDTGSVANNDDGTVTFFYPLETTGETEFSYEICNTACIDYCDTATVNVFFQINPNIDTSVYIANGISPNGDGINDALIIPDILENPFGFPDSELVIFNRWGDIVFRVRDYQNDWEGQDNNGNPLPHATYYYILRLDIASSKIFKGDITILK